MPRFIFLTNKKLGSKIFNFLLVQKKIGLKIHISQKYMLKELNVLKHADIY